MKWLTELRYEVEMNRSFEFAFAKLSVRRDAAAQILCKQSVRARALKRVAEFFAARWGRQENSRRREARAMVPIACAAGKNIVAIIHPTINPS
ncbi:hypothetical protein ACFIOY_12975 [Bradyrhizobium sp. TZ2]